MFWRTEGKQDKAEFDVQQGLDREGIIRLLKRQKNEPTKVGKCADDDGTLNELELNPKKRDE